MNEMIPTDPDFCRELLDKMCDGVYFVDRDRRILYWNEGARRLTGFGAEEIVGQRCQDDILCHMDYDSNLQCRDGNSQIGLCWRPRKRHRSGQVAWSPDGGAIRFTMKDQIWEMSSSGSN